MQLQEIVSRGNWRHGGPPLDAAGRSVPGQVVANSGRHQGDDRVERHAARHGNCERVCEIRSRSRPESRLDDRSGSLNDGLGRAESGGRLPIAMGLIPGSTCRSWASDRVNQHHRKRANQEAFERFWRRSPFQEQPIVQISAINKRLVLRLGGMTLAITRAATGPIRCESPAIWFYETLALEGGAVHPRRGDRQRASRRHRERPAAHPQ